MLTTGGGSLASQRLGVQAHCLRFEIQRGLDKDRWFLVSHVAA